MRDFRQAQVGRTLVHPTIPQSHDQRRHDPPPPPPSNKEDSSNDSLSETSSFSFVVCADTQIGMSSDNKEWETELEYSRIAIRYINDLNPRPKFCCVCGDLCDMESTFWQNQDNDVFTKEQCDQIQERQRKDFQTTWSALHEDIALVCLCGNHDIGNRPTKDSIDSFRQHFGDDYLSFWSTKHSYNIVVNSTLFSNPSGAPDLYQQQVQWLEEQLRYARSQKQTTTATSIFVFGHHPWFLYTETEDADSMTGVSPYKQWKFPDHYFHIPKEQRMPVMDLFRKYGVTAAFSGHFHQNMVSEASFGMKMIVTSSLSDVMNSTGKPNDLDEPNTRGLRIVTVNDIDGSFQHRFVSLPER
ncbi:metallophosphoesterase [Nitzschia inconspicua]|uniref:Metallophosphoesterase n=1 Tax=Nitzschia inconspicua TaxID=303405 RepID=A0A9K3QAJ2_9STRA|nr:metallophosphoesterase [Nitzschia inconspicua]KAG7375014.1 metallophosphoesterase [Nitzschia inconspicua]